MLYNRQEWHLDKIKTILAWKIIFRLEKEDTGYVICQMIENNFYCVTAVVFNYILQYW